MKISRGEITITDVPGVEYIKVKTGNVVSIKFTYFDYAMSYGSSQLVHLRDALTVAIDAMIDGNNWNGPKPIESTSPTAEVGDVFTAGDDEPSNVFKLKDCEGDIWRKADGGYCCGFGVDAWGWEKFINAYGPLTVIEVSE